MDLQAHLVREYGGSSFHVCVVMRDRRVACNSAQPLSDLARRSAAAALDGTDYKRAGGDPNIAGPPIVMAPIQVRKELVGMVVVPPMAPRSAILRDVGRILSTDRLGTKVPVTKVPVLMLASTLLR